LAGAPLTGTEDRQRRHLFSPARLSSR